MGNVRATLRLGLATLTACGWLLTAGAGAEATEVFGAAQGCHPNYQGTCIPTNVTDADCAGGTGDGPHFVQERNVRVVGADLYDLDRDNDGLGCDDTDVTSQGPAQTTATTRAITASGLPDTGGPVERQALAAALLVAVGIYAVRHSERYRKPGMP